MRTRQSIAYGLALGLLACDNPGTPPEGRTSAADNEVYTFLSPSDHLLRASMAIRGTRPNPDQLQAVQEDPDLLPAFVDSYLADPLLGDTIKDIGAELFLVRTDVIDQLPAIGALRGRELRHVHEATAETSLRLFEEIVVEDLPLTELVTADWVWTNPTHALIYGLAFDEERGGWQRSSWDDGRPQAGVLSDSELWRRYESAGSNFHRLRANFVASALLCEDFNVRDIDGASGVDISNEFEVANAVKTVDACVNCHQALDPLAGFFWGFKKQTKRFTVVKAYNQDCRNYNISGESLVENYTPDQFCYPFENYTVGDEGGWMHWDLREPGYYGEPLDHLSDLGDAIAQDPRFAQCMGRTFYAYMTQSYREEVPLELATELQRVLEDSGYDTKALIRHIVLTDSFRASGGEQDAPVSPAGLQTIRPEQYARTIEDLTGFRWWVKADLEDCANPRVDGEGTRCWGEVDLGTTDRFGFRSMSGGLNGYYITSPTHTFTPSKDMVIDRYAFEAAGFVVPRDLDGRHTPPYLLNQVTSGSIEEGVVRDQLVDLHLRILGEFLEADGPEIEETWGLWSQVFQSSQDTQTAWTVTLAALLQDTRMVFY